MDKPKVIYLKALFKKHKAENKLEKIIKDFVVQADIKVDKVKPKVSTGERYLPEKVIQRLSASEYARSTAKKRKNRKRAKYSKKIASMVRNALKVV